ncbi:MAG: nucleoside recognition domain-containing protein [Gammaproteobacteria bacterium]|nr:nucleoside recognition domain-containing protein [Gammaproteobacteria bacterium]
MNYLWAGLIIISLLSAVGQDISDELNNRWLNGQTIHARLSQNELGEVLIQLPKQQLYAHWQGQQLQLKPDQNLPPHWQNIAAQQDKKTPLRLSLTPKGQQNDSVQLVLPEVHHVRLKAITEAAFDMAKFSVKLALGLAGIMALWLGLMRIAEQSGLIKKLVWLVRPLLAPLFPDVPKDHPAFGSISLNLTANLLGLGNAATPMGIRAMQQLQELNQNKKEASDAMCMFLALNTSSVQLLPPVTLIALLGAQSGELILPIILATLASTTAAIIAAKFYARKGKAS